MATSEPGTERQLSAVRRKLKEELEAEELLGGRIFHVWINEDEPAAAADADALTKCLEQVDQADIVLVLFNGHSGWAVEHGEVGICHAELKRAMDRAPGKTRILKLPDSREMRADPSESPRHERFKQYVDSLGRFHASVSTDVELIGKAKETIRAALVDLAHDGVREASRGRFHSGDALNWSRLSFEDRQREMINVLRTALSERKSTQLLENSLVALEWAGRQVVLVPHAIPAALTVPEARELVGRPTLRDHRYAELIEGGAVGPVHVVACHRGATETQAAQLIGTKDATIVRAPFGVFAADEIQKAQLLLIADCRDQTSTRHGVERTITWLQQSGEMDNLARRAAGRTVIVRAIAETLASD